MQPRAERVFSVAISADERHDHGYLLGLDKYQTGAQQRNSDYEEECNQDAPAGN
jgi:hypothetical protein